MTVISRAPALSREVGIGEIPHQPKHGLAESVCCFHLWENRLFTTDQTRGKFSAL